MAKPARQSANSLISISEPHPNRTNGTIFQKNVTTAGTPVQLSTSSVVIPDGFISVVRAKVTNTGNIKIGFSSADITANSKFMTLRPGESAEFLITDFFLLWIDCTVNGEGVEAGAEE